MFQSLKAKNFLSWSDLEFSFEDGVTLIEGYNYDDNTSEGSGKSAIINALCFGLYGRLPKDSTIDEVIKKGEKSCSVEIVLTNGTVIGRTRYPNDLYIREGLKGNPLRGKDARETQKMIEKLIGISFNTFCQTIYFPQNGISKFVSATEEEKAKILSEVQDLNLFDEARVKAQVKIKELELKLSKLNATHQKHLTSYEMYEGELRRLNGLKAAYDVNKQRDIDTLVSFIEEQEKTLTQLKKDKIELGFDPELKKTKQAGILYLEKTLKENQDINYKYNSRLALLTAEKNKESSRVQEMIGKSNCPACGHELDLKHEDSPYKKSINKHLDAIAKIQREIEKITIEYKSAVKDETLADMDDMIQQLRLELEKLNSKEMKLYNINNKIELIDKDIKNKKHQLEVLKAKKIDEFDDKIKQVVDKQDESRAAHLFVATQINDVQQHINAYTTLRASFKEIKSYVFQSLLDDLNERVNHYASQLFETSIHIHFTNLGEEGELSKIICKIELDNQERGYGLLSGGQSKRVEIAVNLALNEIIGKRTKGNWDFRIFDEPFQNLSETSMLKVIDLFKNLPGKTVLIEHNSIAKSAVTNTFNVEYRNGTSRQRIHGGMDQQEGPETQVGSI